MVRRSAAVIIGSIVLSLAAGAATASAATCSDKWLGPGGTMSAATSGDWGTASNWSSGVVPTSSDDVCITAQGTYTVTLAPYVNAVALQVNGDIVQSLTLGSATAGNGAQTLEILGQSSITNLSTTDHSTFLTLSNGGSSTASGKLVVAATSGGSQNDGNPGGNAEFDPGTFTNAGEIVLQSDNAQWGPALGAGTLTNTGLVNDASGLLTSTATTYNDGTFGVQASATDRLEATFANNGLFVNGGVTFVQQSTTPIGWAQTGGAVTGNQIEFRDGATLADSAGTGDFLFDLGPGNLIGTIPAGQTVTVRGELQDTAVTLGGGSASVINRGNLVLEAPGSGTSTGGSTHLSGGPLYNYGRLIASASDSSWANFLDVGVANEPGGTVDVDQGVMNDSGQVANHGIAETAPLGQWKLTSGSTFVNESDGTLEPDLAGASTYGTLSVGSGATFTAAGALAPLQVEHYVPAANTEFRVISLDGGHFTGTFSSVETGFTADYAHESSSPAFVGLIYHKTSPPPPPRKKAVLHVRWIKGGRGTVMIRLQCTGSGTCAKASIVVKLKNGHETHVIARASFRLRAGKSKTLKLKIKTKRKEKVTVTVTAGGKKLKSANVTVTVKK